VGVDPPGADGSGAGAAVASPAPEDSARVDDLGAEVELGAEGLMARGLAGFS
jgi:hypothetical protein